LTNVVVRLRPPKRRDYDPRPLDNVVADPRWVFCVRPSERKRASLLARLAAVLHRAFYNS
jgi:hypothetical protein